MTEPQVRSILGECYDVGNIYLWTCIDQKTKLTPAFLIGKRSADYARRFILDMALGWSVRTHTRAMPTPIRLVPIARPFRSAQTVSLATVRRWT